VQLQPTGHGDLTASCPFCGLTAFHVRPGIRHLSVLQVRIRR
jgi:hypothetical protein